MLGFYFISDEQPNPVSATQLKYAGEIEEEEFEMAQKAGLVESYADYYGKFRWSSKQIVEKVSLLASGPFRTGTKLNGIIMRAKADGFGLCAFGD